MKRIAGYATGATILLLVLVFGWPTPYRYTTLDMAKAECLIRVNRVTGNTDYLCSHNLQNGWKESLTEEEVLNDLRELKEQLPSDGK